MKQASKLERGTRVYYTGDMANLSGFGEIVEVRVDPKWGTSLVVELEAQVSEHGPEYGVEARRFTITPASFADAPGRRFWPLDEWRQHRAEQIAAMTGETVEEVLAKMAEQV